MTKPAPIALVVCDNVYTEPGGKTALVGLFDQLRTERLPVKHPRMCVYASVTDIRPGTRLKLRIVHSETEKVVAELKGPPPKGTAPTTICDFRFILNNLTFEAAGRYYIQFWADDHFLLQRPFEVVVSQKKKEE